MLQLLQQLQVMVFTQKTDVMSDLALANVEALARNEVDQIKCNQAMGGTCVLINNTPIPGEKYN